MGNVRNHLRRGTGDDGPSWHVVDDLPSFGPVGQAELDAVEAFLMPLVNAIRSGAQTGEDGASSLIALPIKSQHPRS